MSRPADEIVDETAVLEAIRRHEEDPEYHDLTLIVQSLNQTPEERLAANEAFVEFLSIVRPEGPLVE
jgi:nitrate reductase assembly molybdenum cofactor insertion protein NarJ